MSNETKNAHVRWEVFVFIVSILMGVFIWFVTRIDNKLEMIGENLHSVDKRILLLEERTKLFEGLDFKQTNMIKDGILRAINQK